MDSDLLLLETALLGRVLAGGEVVLVLGFGLVEGARVGVHACAAGGTRVGGVALLVGLVGLVGLVAR